MQSYKDFRKGKAKCLGITHGQKCAKMDAGEKIENNELGRPM